MTQIQFFATVGAVTLLFIAGGALGAVFTLWLSERPERGKKSNPPAPKANRRTPHTDVAPLHPVTAPPVTQGVVIYQEVTRLPVLDADVTEVREQAPDPTRLDLLKHHTAWGPQAREGRAS